MSASILIPTFNRKKFEKLISHNIQCQLYPFICEVIVCDDGDEDQKLELTVPYPVRYVRVPRMTIGAKRNHLKHLAKGEYLVHMDTDDFYAPQYIAKSIWNLMHKRAELSGSSDMLLTDGEKCYIQRCMYGSKLNEATMVYTKKYAETHHFLNESRAEGLEFTKDNGSRLIRCETMITDIMICVAHDQNTIDKKPWLTHDVKLDTEVFKDHFDILSSLD